MRKLTGLVALVGLVSLLAGCSGEEKLDPKDSVVSSLKGLKNEPYQPRDAGMPKVDKDAAKKKEKPKKETK